METNSNPDNFRIVYHSKASKKVQNLKDLQSLRIIQTNLMFLSGLDFDLANENVTKKTIQKAEKNSNKILTFEKVLRT